MPRVVLAPECLYARLGRWGSGSTLDENLAEVQVNGIRDRAHCPRNWPVRYPANWKTNAARYKGIEAYDLNGDFDLVATALQYGYVVNIGVTWPGGGGHSVCVTELKKRNGAWYVGGPNSWGKSSGSDGFYWLSERQCRGMAAYGAWALRTAVIPSDEIELPKPTPAPTAAEAELRLVP